jgi:cytochrome c oxidase cbb3-type subunit 3
LTVPFALGCFLLAAPSAAQPAGTARPAEELYKTNCAMCHMPDGNAAIKQMNFADGEWKHGTSSKELATVITNGVPGTAMMPFKGRLSEKEILELAKYVRKFDKKLKPEGGEAKSGATGARKSGT